MLRALPALLLLALALGAQPAAAAPVRILFVGDEILDAGDIPARLASLAKAMGREAEVESISLPSYTLGDQWRDGRALEALRKGWTYVVLEQAAAVGADERSQLAASTRRFAERIRAQGAKPALFMTWPPEEQARYFPEAIASARAAAEASGVMLVPAAEAWLRVLSKDRHAGLYSGGARPSSRGGDLAVLTLWFTFFPAGPRDFDDAYVARLGEALTIEPGRREPWIDAATRAVDEPLSLK